MLILLRNGQVVNLKRARHSRYDTKSRPEVIILSEKADDTVPVAHFMVDAVAAIIVRDDDYFGALGNDLMNNLKVPE